MDNQSSIASFLAYYEQAHQNRTNRYVHHAAHVVAVLGVFLLLWGVVSGVLLIAVGFLMSWAGHYLFERNTPAFFDKPTSKSPGAGLVKKIQVAVGGVLWTGACFLRLFNIGPLRKKL